MAGEVKAGQATVLVVDDELGPRESLRTILAHDYQVVVATEGQEALEILSGTPVDIVLLDLRMPGLPGVQVLEQIKALAPDVEVIIITGYASYTSLLQGLHLQVFDYVVKPFDILQLLALIRRALDKRKSRTWLKQVKDGLLAHFPQELQMSLDTVVQSSALLHATLSPLEKTQQLALQHLYISSLRLVHMIDNLSYLTRLETEDVPTTAIQVSLKAVVSRVTARLQSKMDKVGAEIRTEVLSAITLFADERQIEKLLEVLLYRALQTSAQGDVRIQAEQVKGRPEVEITVTDTRASLTEEETAFLKKSEQAEGEGSLFRNIGLGLVVALVRQMRGSLSVRNESDQGTIFCIRLPMRSLH